MHVDIIYSLDNSRAFVFQIQNACGKQVHFCCDFCVSSFAPDMTDSPNRVYTIRMGEENEFWHPANWIDLDKKT